MGWAQCVVSGTSFCNQKEITQNTIGYVLCGLHFGDTHKHLTPKINSKMAA